MTRILKSLLFAALLLQAAPAGAFVVWENDGGLVNRFARIARQHKGPIEIRGLCASACTMYLGAREVCVAPSSTFMFHGAFTDERDPAHSQSPEGSRFMMTFYPEPLRRWIAAQGGLTVHEIWVHGFDLIRLGVAKPCP